MIEAVVSFAASQPAWLLVPALIGLAVWALGRECL